jgi:DNA processing protein
LQLFLENINYSILIQCKSREGGEEKIMLEQTKPHTLSYSPNSEYSEYLNKFGVNIVPNLSTVLGDHANDYFPLFFIGNLNCLFHMPRVAVVGTRQPSELGIARTKKLVKELTSLQISVVSGLAKGIDAIAHSTALELNSTTIAVLGTPVHRPYPAENKNLYSEIIKQGLVLSSAKPHEQTGKYLFPRRNRLMALLCDVTIIVEAGPTSGVIHQAAECLRQKKRLFILKSLAEDKKIEWVAGFLKTGAEVLESAEQLATLAVK